MAIKKRIGQLEPATLPLLGTDDIMVSRDGINTKKAKVSNIVSLVPAPVYTDLATALVATDDVLVSRSGGPAQRKKVSDLLALVPAAPSTPSAPSTGGAASVPAFLVANQVYVVPANSQVLFSDEIEFENGSEIDFSNKSILIEV